MNNQATISRPISLSGKGLHTGKNVTITFIPAPENHGIIFKRVDLPQQPSVKALIENIFDTSRGTSIKENGAEVRTIEHLMAALAGMQIDNLLIEIDAEETPILDGSSRLYVEALHKVERVEQNAEREYYTVQNPTTFAMAENGVEIKIVPADDFQVFVDVDYGTKILAEQKAQLTNIKQFTSDFYNCRTFVFLHELEFLIQHNLVRGGDVDNAIVFVAQKPSPDVMQKLADFFHKTDLQVTENGILNNIELRHENEPARHKLLDIIGDLYLLGKPIRGHVFATKPGHFANTELVKLLR
ncbi:MAG TPA: UDP-3-O-acyl-N-acetylglucosamine deacetylase [Bacteroidales bacterium]|jgi:UDP-3-O-[3-hydroxymyristoyl] N-acetylglucosamine deacetylase / 3-hydroxyacyl-[acyl-carrier-protein] dehydratase|nr:UDP-3-O-acyl-N-acetylglucosamine deacetylase [Bacteroidales bacterium]HNW68665.1 UDP-3-O-acyl-N-acetylglucosamine deacetylase [Bacteroidales bacterium]HPT52471.1 UDP-3-O-acyl-N-acetylglucosamine deacetylase [Bacteroidales bacterium]